jgi:hypothetical protein
LYDGKYKFMQYGSEKLPDELYDISVDPTESQNLVDMLPEISSVMRLKLEKWKKRHQRRYEKKDKSVLTKDVKQNLKALGYLK